MGSHPINLSVRFLLELSALFVMGAWGWRQSDDWIRFFLAFCIPLIAAILWGTFAVPNDPSRSGNAPVPIPGILRLLLELGFFSFAIWALHNEGFAALSWILGILIAVHYIVSYDRILWLIKE